MKLHVTCWILFGFLFFMITGCGGVQDNQDLSSLLVLTPLPTSFLEGDCTNPPVLENWIQILVFNTVEFDNFLAIADGKSRPELNHMVKNLNEVALSVANTPILSCGQEAYGLTISAMQQTLIAMQAYINAERQDLAVILLDAKQTFETATQAQMLVISQLEALYQIPASTP